MTHRRGIRRWSAAVVVLATVLLALPASAACPGCCARAAGSASLGCTVSSECGDCDPFVRSAPASERAVLLAGSLEVVAFPSSAVMASGHDSRPAGLVRLASSPRPGAIVATTPLRL